MNAIKALFVVATLSISSLALAEGGSEQTLARMQQTNQASQATARLANQQQVEAPVAISPVKQAGHANC